MKGRNTPNLSSSYDLHLIEKHVVQLIVSLDEEGKLVWAQVSGESEGEGVMKELGRRELVDFGVHAVKEYRLFTFQNDTIEFFPLGNIASVK